MASHSNLLAWRILWTDEPDGLQCMGLQSRSRLKRLSMHACSAITISRSWCIIGALYIRHFPSAIKTFNCMEVIII